MNCLTLERPSSRFIVHVTANYPIWTYKRYPTGQTVSTKRTKSTSGDTPPHLIAATIRKIRLTRYERERPPRGKQLALIAEKVATIPGCEKEAVLLHTALSLELGTWTAQRIQWDLSPQTNNEKLWVAMLLTALRNPKYAHVPPEFAKAADAKLPGHTSLLDDVVSSMEETIASKKVTKEITRLLKLGVPARAVAQDQGVSLESVEASQRLRHFADSLRELKSQKRGEAKQRALEKVKKCLDQSLAAEPNLTEEEARKRMREFATTVQVDEYTPSHVELLELLHQSRDLVKKGRKS